MMYRLSLLAIAIVFGLAAYRATLWLNGGPRLVLDPPVHEFGEQPHGRDLNATFFVSNSGTTDLVLERFRTSCGCMVVSRRTAVGTEPVKRLVLAPGESMELVTAMATGDSHGRTSGSVTFESNDERSPRAMFRMQANLIGRVYAIPETLNFGQIPLGEKKAVAVRIRDTGRKERIVLASAESSDPQALMIETSEVSERIRNAWPRGDDVYKLDVTLQSHEAGDQRYEIRLYEEETEDPFLTIPVAVSVVSSYRMAPRTLLLPRSTSDGLKYEATAVCSRRDASDFELTVKSAPPWAEVRVRDAPEQAGHKLIELHVQPELCRNNTTGEVALNATCDGTEQVVLCTIRTWSPAGLTDAVDAVPAVARSEND